MIASGRRAITHDGARGKGGACGNQGASLAHDGRRNGRASCRYREGVRRSGSALYHVTRLRGGWGRGSRGARREHGRRGAANQDLALGLSTVFGVMALERYCFLFSGSFRVICRAASVTPICVNEGSSFALCVLAVGHVEARNEDGLYRVEGECFVPFNVVCRRVTSAFR